MVEVEIAPASSEQSRIGEPRAIVLRRIAGDGECLAYRVSNGLRGEIRRACVAAPSANVNRYAYALVTVVRDRLDFVLAR